MMRIFVSLHYVFFSAVLSIDHNEKFAKCLPGFHVPHIHPMQENEGIWFPQYRTWDPKNKRYKCHTIYEKMDYGETTTIYSESYYTKDNQPVQEPYAQSYKQEERDVLVDEEYENQEDAYKVYSYTIAINSEYRVRYVCTNHRNSVLGAPLVYIESRNSNPSFEKIKPAFMDVQKVGMKLMLDRIDQKNCVRPIGYDGYNNSWE